MAHNTLKWHIYSILRLIFEYWAGFINIAGCFKSRGQFYIGFLAAFGLFWKKIIRQKKNISELKHPMAKSLCVSILHIKTKICTQDCPEKMIFSRDVLFSWHFSDFFHVFQIKRVFFCFCRINISERCATVVYRRLSILLPWQYAILPFT